MDGEVVDAFMKTVEVRNPAIKDLQLEWNLSPGAAQLLYIAVKYSCPDRDTGVLVRIVRDSYHELWRIPTVDFLRHLIWREIWAAYDHEAKECFFVSGVRAEDPHANDRPPTLTVNMAIAQLPKIDVSIGFKNPPPSTTIPLRREGK